MGGKEGRESSIVGNETYVKLSMIENFLLKANKQIKYSSNHCYETVSPHITTLCLSILSRILDSICVCMCIYVSEETENTTETYFHIQMTTKLYSIYLQVAMTNTGYRVNQLCFPSFLFF